MSKDHLKTEENHLQIIKDLVEKKYRSKINTNMDNGCNYSWFFGSIFGHRFFF